MDLLSHRGCRVFLCVCSSFYGLHLSFFPLSLHLVYIHMIVHVHETCDVCTHSSSAAIAAESSEVAMERQRRNQETIAEEMVDIARKLRDSALKAKSIITSDTKVCLCMVEESWVTFCPLQALSETNEKAEENITSVVTQTGRMKEHNRGCPWGTILLLALVLCIFLVMVLFIRIIPKPRS